MALNGVSTVIKSFRVCTVYQCIHVLLLLFSLICAFFCHPHNCDKWPTLRLSHVQSKLDPAGSNQTPPPWPVSPSQPASSSSMANKTPKKCHNGAFNTGLFPSTYYTRDFAYYPPPPLFCLPAPPWHNNPPVSRSTACPPPQADFKQAALTRRDDDDGRAARRISK